MNSLKSNSIKLSKTKPFKKKIQIKPIQNVNEKHSEVVLEMQDQKNLMF